MVLSTKSAWPCRLGATQKDFFEKTHDGTIQSHVKLIFFRLEQVCSHLLTRHQLCLRPAGCFVVQHQSERVSFVVVLPSNVIIELNVPH